MGNNFNLGLGITLGSGQCVPSEGGGGGAPAWLPEGALIYADFVNGHYWAGGAEVAVTDLWLQDNNSGYDFNAATDIGVNGLQATGQTLWAALNSTYTSGLLENMSFVADITGQAGSIYFWTVDSPNYNSSLYLRATGDSPNLSTPDGGVDGDPHDSASRRKIGATYLTTIGKFVENGGTVFSKTFSARAPDTPTQFAIQIGGSAGIVHSIAFYAALSDAQLQALTA